MKIALEPAPSLIIQNANSTYGVPVMAMMNVSIEFDINEWARDFDEDRRNETLEEAVVRKLAEQSFAYVTQEMRRAIQSDVEAQAQVLMSDAIHKIIQEKLHQLMHAQHPRPVRSHRSARTRPHGGDQRTLGASHGAPHARLWP